MVGLQRAFGVSKILLGWTPGAYELRETISFVTDIGPMGTTYRLILWYGLVFFM